MEKLDNRSTTLGYVAGILAAVFYGTNPLGTLPLYADGVNSASVLFYRYALAALMFAVWMIATRQSFRIKVGHAIKFALFGSLFALSSVSLYVSFKYMDAGVASTILFCYPIMVAVLMAVFYHEHVTWQTTLSITLATSGIALLYRGGGDVTLNTTGLSLVILSSLFYSFYIISVQQWKNEYNSLQFTFWIVLFGLITILLYSFFAGQPLQMLHGVKQWACGAQLALLPTVLSLYFMTVAIKNIGSTPAAILGALEPVTAVCIGVGIFGEEFSVRLACGILLILSAVILIILRKSKRN